MAASFFSSLQRIVVANSPSAAPPSETRATATTTTTTAAEFLVPLPPPPPPQDQQQSQLATPLPARVLTGPPHTGSPIAPRNVVLFIHGFLGSEESFHDFPAHIEARLRHLHGFESFVFPAYDCKHSLVDAARRVAQYLREMKPSAAALNVVLVAHSMGGLVAADTVRILSDRSNPSHVAETDAAIRVLGIQAFDTPYFHLEPSLTNMARQPIVNAMSAVNSAGSFWVKMAALAVPLALGAAAIRFVPAYLDFLGPLFSESMDTRAARIQYVLDQGIRFKTYYPRIDTLKHTNSSATFIYLPTDLPPSIYQHFIEIPTSQTNPVEAHTHIFDPVAHPQHYGRLVADTVQEIRDWHLGNDPLVVAAETAAVVADAP
ncbi:hypothetical protein BC828DRAFT_371697 [Blastocladiella britannica]|nr:hypothetical protein BC828DRAFT_371697 [Blastocladiella britannica]